MRGTSGTPRRTKRSRYRCSLPGLAGFAGLRRTEPEVPRIGSRATRAEDCKRSLAQRRVRKKNRACGILSYFDFCRCKIRMREKRTEPRAGIMARIEALWEDETGTPRITPGKLEDKSPAGTSVRVEEPIRIGTRVIIRDRGSSSRARWSTAASITVGILYMF